MSDFGAVRQRIKQHAVGLTGQIAAGVPLLLVTLVISRTNGLEAAGKFSIAVGLSATLFSTAWWGFGSHIVLDRFKDFEAFDYALGRGLALCVAAAVTLAGSVYLHIPLLLALAVILFRIGDAFIDLTFAFNQVWQGLQRAMNMFAFQHVAKIVVLGAVAAPAVVLGSASAVNEVFASGILICAGTGYWLLRQLPKGPRRFQSLTMLSLFGKSRWLAIAILASSVLVSSPRIVLAWLYSGATLGVAGISVSVMAFMGMAYYTGWLRHQEQFGKSRNNLAVAFSFVGETVLIGALAALGSWFVFPQLVGAVFGFHGAEQLVLCRDILVAGCFFSGATTLTNIYKATHHRWLETVAYLFTLACAGLCLLVLPGVATLPRLLAICGALLFVTAIPAFVLLRRGEGDRDMTRKVARFARLASRPVPRIVRFMTVAAENGYDCAFIGAMRGEGLPANDTWQGFPIHRVGKVYPLLNGKNPLLYLRSVFGFGIALFNELRRERPAIVHASDFEAMPSSILYKMIYGTYLVYNIHDNVSQRYQIPSLMAKTLDVIDGVFVRNADIATVPEKFRRDALPAWCRSKIEVVRNSPEDPGFTPPDLSDTGKIRIFYGGWIDSSRGLAALLDLVERNPNIELRVAGEGEAAIVADLVKRPRVTFLGYVENKLAIEETRKCHFIAAFYDPRRLINRFAASNKLAESLAVGRPVLINGEMEVSKEFTGNPGVIAVPYARIADMGADITALFEDKARYQDACVQARRAYDSGYAWAEVRTRIKDVLLPKA